MSNKDFSFLNSFMNTIPTVTEVVTQEIKTQVDSKVRVSIPAVVVGVSDYSTLQVLDVRPLVGIVYNDGEELSPPTLKKIFVKLPRSGGFNESYPVKKDELVTLHYTHRSIYGFLSGDGSEFKASEDDKWGLKDCYITLGFGTFGNNISPDPENYRFQTTGGEYKKTITPSGDVTEGCVNLTETASVVDKTFKDTTLTTTTYTQTSTVGAYTYSECTVISPSSYTITSGAINLTAPSVTVSGTVTAQILSGLVEATGGWSGTFATGDSRTVTVAKGVITNVI